MRRRPYPELSPPIFVMHLHRVVHRGKNPYLHLDLRVEFGSVLVSWAIDPRLVAAPGASHRAVRVNDHKLSYGDFEGRIPGDAKGAGTVIVWDHGRVTLDPGRPGAGLRTGDLRLVFHGQKLKGAWSLRRRAGSVKEWRFVKEADPRATGEELVVRYPRSTVSGKTLEAVENDPSTRMLTLDQFRAVRLGDQLPLDLVPED